MSKKSSKISGSNRGNKNNKKTTVRSSLSVCEERLACKGDRTEAKFECNECKTLQCEVCEELLHENPRFDFHERNPLKSVPPELICQNPSCTDRNFADWYCKECQSRLCSACDSTVHSGSNVKKHSKELISWQQIATSSKSNSSASDLPPTSDNHSLPNGCAENNKPSTDDDSSSGLEGLNPLPDIAQMSLDAPSGDFRTADFEEDSEMEFAPSSSGERGKREEGDRKREGGDRKSFLLLDEVEKLQISSAEDFAKKLGCESDSMVKVVSIFGNTGEGKSHTLNYTFFGGREVFKTSPAQSSCTIGIWAAYDPVLNMIVVDTEGLLGISENNNRRTRLLLKVLAISDVIIYRTRAERLHNDLFTFLGDASRAYVHHFSSELRSASQRSGLTYSVSDLGPVVIIFHETLYTEILTSNSQHSPEDELRRRFHTLNLTTEAYSAFEYVATRTLNPPTSFKSLQTTMKRHLTNSTVRSSRGINVVYLALKHLNEKFNGDIEKSVPCTFPDEYFTCSMQCLSCSARCTNSMNHQRDGSGHKTVAKCVYQHQYDNKVYHCRSCYDRGNEVLVIPKTSECNDPTWFGLAKYAWYGYVLECDRCGVIYRSRKYWYGNSDPWDCVREEIQHVWPGESNLCKGSQNAAQKVLEGFQYIAETASSVSAAPTRRIGSWVADQINPAYWKPNAEIKECNNCGKEFAELDVKHHCRNCGEGFCAECSSKKHSVPEKGWEEEVRVCDDCFDKLTGSLDASSVSENGAAVTPQEVTVRKYGEVVTSTIGNVASAIDYPLTWIKESARPEYWVPDKEITECFVCETKFSEKLPIHHCRSCGNGVCDDCSRSKLPVKNRGWDSPVRVCDSCIRKPTA